MGDHIKSSDKIDTRTIGDTTIDIWRVIWASGGVGYQVYSDEDECLNTGEDFDTIPDNGEIALLLSGEDWAHMDPDYPHTLADPRNYPG